MFFPQGHWTLGYPQQGQLGLVKEEIAGAKHGQSPLLFFLENTSIVYCWAKHLEETKIFYR